MIYRCEILNHGIDGYEVWLHGRNQGRSGVNVLMATNKYIFTIIIFAMFIFYFIATVFFLDQLFYLSTVYQTISEMVLNIFVERVIT